ncbi:MAG: hypothetical protein WDZ59_00245 [Pirellulales bacterium]
MTRPHWRTLGLLSLAALVPAALATAALACPFCSAASQTLSEEMDGADVVVIAKLLSVSKTQPEDTATPADTFGSGSLTSAKFRVADVLKGKQHTAVGREIEVTYFGEEDKDGAFLISGLSSPTLEWATPLPLSEKAREYIKKLPSLPAEGADRLDFFQGYLENPDPMLAQDAYDEFARAPYEGVIALKERMRHDQLVEWIENPDVAPSRRRLYLTMLGVCGTKEDVPMLEKMIRSEDRQLKQGLDALIGCYLTLEGADGLPLIEDLFLKSKDAQYTDTYSAVMALRFHGQETDVIPKDRLLVAMRHLLDHPELADQIIPDLARWEDWSVMDRLVDLFKNADEKSRWVRIPVIRYLQAAISQEGEVGQRAQAYMTELEKVDPETVERAKSFLAFGGLIGGAPPASATTEEAADETTGSEEQPEEQPAEQLEEETAPATEESDSEAPEAAAEDADKSAAAGLPPEPPATGSQPVEATIAGAEIAEDISTAASAPLVPEIPSRWAIVGVPLAAGAVLLVVLWMIIGGAGQQRAMSR